VGELHGLPPGLMGLGFVCFEGTMFTWQAGADVQTVTLTRR
jgi:hypothetical protein